MIPVESVETLFLVIAVSHCGIYERKVWVEYMIVCINAHKNLKI